MSEENTKCLENENTKQIKEMIKKFAQCVDEASNLSKSIESFEKVYSNIAKNVTSLNEISKNLNSDESIKELLNTTSSMEYAFSFFNSNIPKLSKSMETSTKELNSYNDNFKNTTNYFQQLTYEIDDKVSKMKSTLSRQASYYKNVLDELQSFAISNDKKMESLDEAYNKTSEKLSETINQHIDSKLIDFKEEILKSVNDNTDRIINEKVQLIIGQFDNIIETIAGEDSYQKPKSIHRLCIENNGELPIYIKKYNWSNNDYFKVEKIEKDINSDHFGLTAYGKRFKDNNSESSILNADKSHFLIFAIDNLNKK